MKKGLEKLWLFDLCNPKQWKTLSMSKLKDSGYPVYGANGKIGFYDEYNHKKPTILVTCRGATCGQVHICEPYSYVTGNAMALDDLDANKVDIKYFFHRLKSRGFSDVISGTAQPQITRSNLEYVHFFLPSLEKQKRIAAILDKADAICRKREKAIELADGFLKSVFLDMFGDPVTNQKRWPERKLSEISEIKSGVTKGRKFNGKKTSFVPYMRVANVQDGFINLDDISDIEVLESDVDKYKLCSGDLLLTEGGDPDKLGRGAVWEGKIDPCIHQNHIFRVRTKKEVVLPEYLSMQIGSNRGKRYFLRSAKQTTGVASINITQLKNYIALVPPMDIQERFYFIEKKFKDFRRKLLQEKHNSDNLFNSLSQRAFRGDL
ncbi:hypothetical protein DSCW_56990 [Desulfosarcina widdelii]|uniref:Type I restriction modification DNA specificity domain-containing protein n=1 Tax=Desulfosarcina widdelii TaxID=947919 RepID=A0A5K7Z8C9_9BACT|nr:restriction endonuclease subunit S [Desulfosarcina widdelii]BBO78282.1 hypothetical protein DSCW_56990 [Desulfosarcina widdelii]